MNNPRKSLFLFLALLLPVVIFIFLRLFGRNEFAVQPLFEKEPPPAIPGCPPSPVLPYVVHDSIRARYIAPSDSLTVIFYGPLTGESRNQFARVAEEARADVHVAELAEVPGDAVRSCAFFLQGDTNVVMLDRRGAIRGQYASNNREDIDRLLTEITIILKKY